MNIRKICAQLAAAIVITAMIGFNAPARASELTWNWSWSGSDTGSGTLTTNALSNGSYLITAMSGTWDGDSITGLLPCCTSGNDNLLLAGSPQLDASGLAFTTSGNGIGINFYYNSTYDTYQNDSLGPFSRSVNGTFSAALVSASEPGTAVLLAAGLAALGFAVSRRKITTDA